MPQAEKVPHTQDQEFLNLLLLLRYGSIDCANYQQPVLNISSVARIVRKPASTVAELLKLALCTVMLGVEVKQRKRLKFTHEHISYLVNKQTLI